jgi:hypothetical protein
MGEITPESWEHRTREQGALKSQGGGSKVSVEQRGRKPGASTPLSPLSVLTVLARLMTKLLGFLLKKQPGGSSVAPGCPCVPLLLLLTFFYARRNLWFVKLKVN